MALGSSRAAAKGRELWGLGKELWSRRRELCSTFAVRAGLACAVAAVLALLGLLCHGIDVVMADGGNGWLVRSERSQSEHRRLVEPAVFARVASCDGPRAPSPSRCVAEGGSLVLAAAEPFAARAGSGAMPWMPATSTATWRAVKEVAGLMPASEASRRWRLRSLESWAIAAVAARAGHGLSWLALNAGRWGVIFGGAVGAGLFVWQSLRGVGQVKNSLWAGLACCVPFVLWAALLQTAAFALACVAALAEGLPAWGWAFAAGLVAASGLAAAAKSVAGEGLTRARLLADSMGKDIARPPTTRQGQLRL